MDDLKLEFHRENRTHRAEKRSNDVFRPDAALCVRFPPVEFQIVLFPSSSLLIYSPIFFYIIPFLSIPGYFVISPVISPSFLLAIFQFLHTLQHPSMHFSSFLPFSLIRVSFLFPLFSPSLFSFLLYSCFLFPVSFSFYFLVILGSRRSMVSSGFSGFLHQ